MHPSGVKRCNNTIPHFTKYLLIVISEKRFPESVLKACCKIILKFLFIGLGYLHYKSQ